LRAIIMLKKKSIAIAMPIVAKDMRPDINPGIAASMNKRPKDPRRSRNKASCNATWQRRRILFNLLGLISIVVFLDIQLNLGH